MKNIILLIVVITALLSCRAAPKALKYYKTAVDRPQKFHNSDSVRKYFSVSAFPLDPESVGSTAIDDLSDKGQGALIEAMNSKTSTPAQLLSAIAQPIRSSSVASVNGSLLWKKRIVLNILKADPERANRIQQILFTFQVPDSLKEKIEFVSWDKIVSATQTIDLGKITTGGTNSVSFSPELNLAGVIQGKLPGAFSSEKTFSEEKSYVARMAVLNAAVVNKSMFQVFRQAVPNEDISGNIVVELTMRSKLAREVTIFGFDGLFDSFRAQTDQTRVKINRSLLVRPDFASVIPDIPLNLTYDFRYRIVGEGKETEPEYDDVVEFQDGKIGDLPKFMIFNAEDSQKIKTWEISAGKSSLHIYKTNAELLTFDSYSDAQQLLQWIKETSYLKIADYDFYLGANRMTTSDFDKLLVKPAN